MEVQKFPPSPNWYLSDVLCAGINGTVIYGSRNTLVIAKFEDKLFVNSSFPDYEIIDQAHTDRITTVRFCPSKSSKYNQYFASGGDDSVVKLWQMTTLTPVMANFDHGEGKKVISMDWTWGVNSHVLSVDNAGLIVAWNLEKNLTSKINIAKLLQAKKNVMLKANAGKLLPLVVKCCPHQEDLVAVGMKGGLVCLLTLRDSGRILHCMRGHDKDVTSLSWCPVMENVLGGKDDVDQDKAFLLASVCKDRYIFLWRCIDGHFLRTIKLPTTFLGRHSRLPASGTYVSLDWPLKETIICSSNYGEIIKFDLSPSGGGLSDIDTSKSDKPIQPKSQWCLIHDIHPRCVFAVHCTQYTKAGEGAEEKTVVWTTAQDRHLVAASLDDGKVLVNIPTIGGFVYCMASSPFDPSRIAVGIGDFSIRIWNTGNTKDVQMSTLWQKIKGKVMAVAWHPTQEMKLAFGTHEGRVGIQDISPGRLPVVFILRHQHAVYALSWGPPCYKEGESVTLPQFCLYSCGDGEILLYNPDAPDQEPKRMSLLMKGGEKEPRKKGNPCTDVAWKPDYSLLAVGNNDGSVQLFTPPHLKLVYTLYAHRKLLMTLIWHPMSTSSDTGLSSMRHCLATGSNENVIHVYDLTNLINAVAEGAEYNNPIQSIAKLTGHQKKVVRLSWSPHTSGQLCSASYDNTVRVWDIVHQTCIACFMGHSGAGLACMWSSFDPDIIISGSTDFTLCAWRISTAKYVEKHTSVVSAKKKLPPITPSPVDNAEKLEKMNGSTSNVPVAKSAKIVESSKGSFTWKGSLFPISWRVAGGIGVVDGVQQLLKKQEEGTLEASDESNDAKLLFFGDRDDMHNLLKKEESHHMAQNNVEQVQLMGLWRGNVADMIKDAIAKGNLSDWLVSMAPTASHKLWVEACQAYSEQLAANGKFNHAATYLLTCHKVDDAIKLLRSRSLFREALAIARCRLAPDDPTAHEIAVEWGRNLFLKGNYEVAAMCFTAVGEYLEAARALASRTTYPECIAMAATLALKAGGEGKSLALMFAMQCIHLNLQKNNWDAALAFIEQVKELTSLSLVVELHRRLNEGFQVHKKEGGDLLYGWLKGGSKEDKSVDQSPSCLLQPSTPLPWIGNEELSADDAYSCISNRRGDKDTCPVKNFFLELAEELALSICAASSEGELNVKKWNHILKAMTLCYSQHLFGMASEDVWKHSLLKFCTLLAPNGPEDISQLFEEPTRNISPEGFTRSVKAYVVFSAIAWVEEKWEVEKESEWPWSELAVFLLGHLPDILDQQTADYFKAEVEIRKVEQELIKAKARFKLVGENSFSGVPDKPVVGDSGVDPKELPSEENGIDGSGDSDRIGDGFQAMTISESGQEGKTLEEVIRERETEIGTLRDQRESFERDRISAPNPFISFFKLRNVCDMIVKSYASKENNLPSDVQELQKKIISGIAF